jgi:hypothetical protein
LTVAHVAEFYFVGTTLKLGQDLKHGRIGTENQQDYALLELHEKQQPIFVEKSQNWYSHHVVADELQGEREKQ